MSPFEINRRTPALSTSPQTAWLLRR